MDCQILSYDGGAAYFKDITTKQIDENNRYISVIYDAEVPVITYQEGAFIELTDGSLIDQKDWETSGKSESDVKGIYVSDGGLKVTLSLKQSPSDLKHITSGSFSSDYIGIQKFNNGKECQKWMEEHYPDLSNFPAFNYCKEQGGYMMSLMEGALLPSYYKEIAGVAARLKKNGIDADGIKTDTVVFLEDGSFKLRTADSYSGEGTEVQITGVPRSGSSGNLWFSSFNNVSNGYTLYVTSGLFNFFTNSLTYSYVVRPALY